MTLTCLGKLACSSGGFDVMTRALGNSLQSQAKVMNPAGPAGQRCAPTAVTCPIPDPHRSMPGRYPLMARGEAQLF